MKLLVSFFQISEQYTGLMLLLAAELLAAAALLCGFLHVCREKKKIEERRKGEQFYLKAASQGQNIVQMLIRRKDYCPVFITENFEEVLGIRTERVYGDLEILYSLMVPDEGRKLRRRCETWDGEKPIRLTFQEAGGKRWFRFYLCRCQDQIHDLLALEDVTEEQNRWLELEERLAKTEETSRSKTTFLSRMSHEIRTPMNGIIGMLSLASAQLHDDCRVESYLKKAEELSQFLLSLINDILDMSRIEAGKIELEEKEFDLFALADKLCDMFQKNVEAKGIRFQVELLDFDVRWLIGDELRISQVLVNFLSNAVKFTSEGEITVTFRQMMRRDDRLDLMVRVHDTGIGMEPEFITRIFRPFEQESTEVTKKYGGSGLGMAIADQIVRLMGGEIVIDSLPGRGSDFTVFLSLPVAKQQQEHQKQEYQQGGETGLEKGAERDGSAFTYAGLHILMAEDNEINAEIAVSILEMQGASVEVAANGQLAVDCFAANPPGTYDLILMDIQMPVMGGREATRTIRAMEREDAGTIPIFALSADAFVEDKRLSIENGMNGHFSKPIDFEAMRIAIGRFMEERREK